MSTAISLISMTFVLAFIAVSCQRDIWGDHLIRLRWRRTPGKSFDIQKLGTTSRHINLDRAPGIELDVDAGVPEFFRELFYKLQNWEVYQNEIRPMVTRLLQARLSEVSSNTASNPGMSILSVEPYSPNGLRQFLQGERDKVVDSWDEYLVRRSHGRPRELFHNLDQAVSRLKAWSPVKLIDGAWLARIHECSSPESVRPVISKLRHILLEELGDGNLERNHVYLYRKLLKDIGTDLPEVYEKDYGATGQGITDLCAWQGAIDQLLLSALAQHCLPEILGFNLHFEAVTLETLVAARELRELRLDATYFRLHICIDNADTGHEAIALEAIDDYMKIVSSELDDSHVHEHWHRIQLGYLLAKDSAPSRFIDKERVPIGEPQQLIELEHRVLAILDAKSRVAHKLHNSGGRRYTTRTARSWLDPEAFSTETARAAYLAELSEAHDLIHPGDSSRSWLLQEAAWGGRMYGAFSTAEIRVLATWIDSLPPHRSLESSTDPRLKVIPLSDDTMFNLSSSIAESDVAAGYKTLCLPFSQPVAADRETPLRLIWSRDLLIIWSTYAQLLQNVMISPSRTANKIVCLLIQVHRAQLGYLDDTLSDTKTDPVFPNSSLDLRAIVREVGDIAQLSSQTHILEDVTAEANKSFITLMHKLSRCPYDHIAAIVGTACAFTELHELIYCTQITRSSNVLQAIANVEREILTDCIEELVKDQTSAVAVSKFYTHAKQMIANAGGSGVC